ncbi:MAG: 2-oxoglutarate dehydrogenase complex dihydrolipoyllysine-residue succinyltransferase [Dehalococcoidia bacterium]
MAVEIRVPEMAESVVEATVGAWLKQEGDTVTSGETVLELETDKVNLEVTAAQSGKIEKILKATGDTVVVGDVLGMIGEASGASAETSPEEPAAAPAKPSQVAQTAEAGPAAEAKPSETDDATPVARRLAEVNSVDLSNVKGTGRGGRITKEDVEAAIGQEPEASAPKQEAAPSEAPPASPAQSDAAPRTTAPRQAGDRSEERVRLSRRRLTIATRLAEVNREAVMTTTYNEVDMSAVMSLRKLYREDFRQRHGSSLGFMSFFVKAVVGGLQAQPVLNSELQESELVLKHYYDIGIAVATDDGLVVPVVRDADARSFAEIESEIGALAAKARERKLTLDELRGGTFSITNGGVFGSLMSTPILNPPQVAILGMHRIQERPMAVDGQVVIRPMMYVAVTYDHRVVEGADAVQFLVRVKQLLEDPARLLINA